MYDWKNWHLKGVPEGVGQVWGMLYQVSPNGSKACLVCSLVLSRELFIQMCTYVFENQAVVRGLYLTVFTLF